MAEVTIEIHLSLVPHADREAVAERLFEKLASDPFDEYPEIETVDGWDVR